MGGEVVYGVEHVVVTNGAVQAVWDCLALSVEGPEVGPGCAQGVGGAPTQPLARA